MWGLGGSLFGLLFAGAPIGIALSWCYSSSCSV